ncbi:hypothetical protein N9A16_01930 [Pontimonas sp.]|nr:hypothetical protein [Pontimonas sp.]
MMKPLTASVQKSGSSPLRLGASEESLALIVGKLPVKTFPEVNQVPPIHLATVTTVLSYCKRESRTTVTKFF